MASFTTKRGIIFTDDIVTFGEGKNEKQKINVVKGKLRLDLSGNIHVNEECKVEVIFYGGSEAIKRYLFFSPGTHYFSLPVIITTGSDSQIYIKIKSHIECCLLEDSQLIIHRI